MLSSTFTALPSSSAEPKQHAANSSLADSVSVLQSELIALHMQHMGSISRLRCVHQQMMLRAAHLGLVTVWLCCLNPADLEGSYDSLRNLHRDTLLCLRSGGTQVGRAHHIRAPDQRVVGGWLLLKYVQRGLPTKVATSQSPTHVSRV